MNGMKRLACVLIVFGAAVLPRAAAADEITGVIAEGGDVIQYTVDGSGDVYHAFTTPGSVQFFHATEASYFVEYLVVGGGGGSGGDGYCGGGGGGGAVLTGSLYVHKGEYLACEVGAGGAAGGTGGTTTLYYSPDGVGLGAEIAVAPGGGGGSGRITNGKNGANGGGSGGQDNKNAQYYGGKSTTWFDEGGFLIVGHKGGDALLPYTQAKFIGTGGGGAGGDGGNALSTQGGAGGLGIKSSITGEELGYGGGGGGSGYGATPGGAGADGGGNGAASKQGEAGLPNRGGGAGGGKTGNAGGNGVVILRYTPVSGAVAMVCTPKVVDYTSITFEFSVALLDNADDRCTITAVFSADGEIYSAPMTVVSELVSGEVKQGTVSGLSPSTKYSFRFVITDEHGNSSTYEEALSTKVLGGVGGDRDFAALDGSGDRIHYFSTPSVTQFFTAADAPLAIEYLVVGGGGGGGGGSYSAGGGAGGVVRSGSVVLPALKSLAICVGAGGEAGQPGQSSTICFSDDGVTTGDELVTAMYGGAGAGWKGNGGAGGNGGGSGGRDNSGSFVGGKSIWLDVDEVTPLGYAGGDSGAHKMAGGGGGGAGGPGYADGGSPRGDGYAGDGGPGVKSAIVGYELGYGGGGGGSKNGSGNATGPGIGTDGGGDGGAQAAGVDGKAETGGGGGGGANSKSGGKGGSGVVILRYAPVQSLIKGSVSIDEVGINTALLSFSMPFLANDGDWCSLSIAWASKGSELGSPVVLKDGDWNINTESEVSYLIEDLKPGVAYRYRAVFQDAHNNRSEIDGEFLTPKDMAKGGNLILEMDDGSIVHYFYSDGVFELPAHATEVRYLVVGGGGGSANDGYSSGGGGGGGVLTGKVEIAASSKLLVTIGAGGVKAQAGGASSVVLTDDGVTPGESLFVAPGGGYGGYRNANGGDGANGGGAGGNDGKCASGGLSNWYEEDGETPRGFPGGKAAPTKTQGYMTAGGGGGAGGPGGDGQNGNIGGDGGAGIWSDITGENLDYGGGGGGTCAYSTTGTGGVGHGGGGSGGKSSNDRGINAIPNRGGGAQGCKGGADGGSGVVIFRYFPAGHPAVAAVSELEKGPGFIRANIQVLACGDGDEAVDVYVACGPEGGESGEYTLVKSGVAAGEAVEHLAIGLEAEAGCAYSVKMVGTDTGAVDYSVGTLTTDAAIESAVPTLADVAVAITDVEKGTVEASAFVAWGGGKSALCQLVLKYGSEAGVYTKERVISAADIGTIRGTCSFRSGTWYAVLVARSSEGESAPSEEFTLYSERNRKGTVFYLK